MAGFNGKSRMNMEEQIKGPLRYGTGQEDRNGTRIDRVNVIGKGHVQAASHQANPSAEFGRVRHSADQSDNRQRERRLSVAHYLGSLVTIKRTITGPENGNIMELSIR